MSFALASYSPAALTAELERRECLRSFPAFARRAWREVDSAPLVWNWALDIVTSECQAWALGEVANLAIAIPPGSGKSLIASVLLPAWMWARQASTQFLCAAHGSELTIRDNVRCRDLIRSEWYTNNFVDGWRLKKDQDQKTRYANTAGGLRQGVGGKSGLTGWRGDKIIVDDPVDINPRKPPRIEDYDTAWNWIKYIRRSRVNDPKRAQTLMIMQRSSEIDPIGRLLKEMGDEEWRFVFLDQEYDPTMPFRHPDDPRREPGELLIPERVGALEARRQREDLGELSYAAQYQQQPAPSTGAIIGESWFVELPRDELPHVERADWVISSWDCAFKDNESSSWVVASKWGAFDIEDPTKRRFVLYDVVREHLGYVATREAIRRHTIRNPELSIVLVEDKANGTGIIDELKWEIPIIYPHLPQGSKEQRLRAISHLFHGGRVIVPADAPWLATYKAELSRFPKYGTDDQVDSTTQAIHGLLYDRKKWERRSIGGSRVYGGY